MTRCLIQISIDVPETFTEVATHDVVSTEIAVEGGVSPILAELFGGTILVDDVSIQYSELVDVPMHL